MFKLDYSFKYLTVRYVEAILSRPNAGNPEAILNEAERMALVTFAAFAKLDKAGIDQNNDDKPLKVGDRVAYTGIVKAWQNCYGTILEIGDNHSYVHWDHRPQGKRSWVDPEHLVRIDQPKESTNETH
jgi:hypothetical protein